MNYTTRTKLTDTIYYTLGFVMQFVQKFSAYSKNKRCTFDTLLKVSEIPDKILIYLLEEIACLRRNCNLCLVSVSCRVCTLLEVLNSIGYL